MADETQAVDAGTDVETAPEESKKEKEKLQQTVDIRDVGPCRKHIKVTISRATIDQQLDEKFKELMGESFVPGFRPGKAPRKIVVQRYKKEAGIGSVVALMLPYVAVLTVAWILFFVAWYLIGIPLGPGAPVHVD